MLFGSDDPEPDEQAEFWQLQDPDAAPRHFLLARQGDRFRLRDLGYGHGPFINGRQVGDALLKPGDYFDFGNYRYQVSTDGLTLAKSPRFPASLAVYDLSATIDGKRRLTHMSFVQRQNELVAILGPSGAGKTSLFYALVGELKLDQGGELYLGELSLRTQGEQIRTLLGFVPQEEHLFRTFTVRQLLRYSYRLRSPSNRTRRDQRIDEVCEQLKISGQVNQLIGTLSGGQRKRVSIAVELLSKPKLLMLDEPTSGLDAGMDREVLTILGKYAEQSDAEQGNTVIVITHSTEHLGLARQVLVVADGGRPVYYGRPDEVLDSLEVSNFAELMHKLMEDSDSESAAQAYQQGPRVREARAEANVLAHAAPGSTRNAGRIRKIAIGRRQLPVLIQRQAALLIRRGATSRSQKLKPLQQFRGLTTTLAPLLTAVGGALLASLVSGSAGLGIGHGPHGSQTASGTLSLLITLCMLCGQALTYSDIVNDYPTIHREYRTGVFTLPVLLSKWLVFALVAALQGSLITIIFLWLRPGPVYGEFLSPVAGLFADLIMMTIAAMTLGLLISAWMRKLEQAIAVATIASIAQIALNGVASNLSANPAMNYLSMLLPARWGLSAAAASINLRHISPLANPDALWSHSLGQWLVDLSMLGVLSILNFLLARALLARRLSKPD
jgi:ABC-type multidrug transport system ATPase subunit